MEATATRKAHTMPNYAEMDFAAVELKVFEDLGGDLANASVLRGTPKFTMLCVALNDVAAAAAGLARGSRAARRELEDVERMAIGTEAFASIDYTARIPALRAAFYGTLAAYTAALRMAQAA
jgi:hypothetical protein